MPCLSNINHYATLFHLCAFVHTCAFNLDCSCGCNVITSRMRHNIITSFIQLTKVVAMYDELMHEVQQLRKECKKTRKKSASEVSISSPVSSSPDMDLQEHCHSLRVDKQVSWNKSFSRLLTCINFRS